jgi:hypothetical protein
MSEQTEEFEIRFDNLPVSEAGKNASNLRRELAEISPDVSVSLKKDDPTNQDFGATLILVLGTPAIIVLAKGIASYLARSRGTISISKNGQVVATGISGEDAARIAEVMSQRKR